MNKTIIYWALITLGMSIASCISNTKKTNEDYQIKFKDVLNIKKVPSEKHNLDAFGFSDKGAWHAYSLPNMDSTDYHGGFCGPLLIKNYGTWLGKKTSRLILMDNNEKTVSWIKDSTSLIYYPGKLEQKHASTDLNIVQELIFADERTALIKNSITNISDKTLSFKWKLENKYFEHKLDVKKNDNQLFVYLEDSSFLCMDFNNMNFDIIVDSTGTIINGNERFSINPGETFEIAHTESYFFNQKEYELKQTAIKGYLNNSDKVFDENSKRWNKYLSTVLNKKSSFLDSLDYQKLAVKSIQTLISNWRSPAGALKHNGLFPSTAYHGFYGFWSWDSWKHAVALVIFDAHLAKESVRCMFDFQNSAGMIADCVYQDSTENNWRDTKPPLAAWAVWTIFEKTKDTSFIREMYPALQKYHKWWYKDRDFNKNGICEYGSSDGTLIAAKWESGMDNAVRFDSTKLLKNNVQSWSMDQESVDLNVFLQKEKEYLNQLATVLNKTEDAHDYSVESAELKELITKYFWSDESNYFFDYNFQNNKFIEAYGPEGWLSLWTGIATKEQAKHIAAIMLDTTRFNTKVPFPTLDASHKSFNPLKGYWRGPVWLDQVWFGIEGLHNYGYTKEADMLKLKLFKNSEGLLSNKAIRENYHPLSGKGLNAEHFSWSAAHILLMITE